MRLKSANLVRTAIRGSLRVASKVALSHKVMPTTISSRILPPPEVDHKAATMVVRAAMELPDRVWVQVCHRLPLLTNTDTLYPTKLWAECLPIMVKVACRLTRQVDLAGHLRLISSLPCTAVTHLPTRTLCTGWELATTNSSTTECLLLSFSHRTVEVLAPSLAMAQLVSSHLCSNLLHMVLLRWAALSHKLSLVVHLPTVSRPTDQDMMSMETRGVI